MRFFDFLFPPRVDEALVRDISIDEFFSHLAPKLVSQTHPETVALLPFSTSVVRAAVHEAKYHGSRHAFALLGAVLTEYLRDMDERAKSVVLVPIPLGKKRQKERGFNQVEEIAKHAARELGYKLDTSLLVRTRETTTQVSLPREERERNMRGAFEALHHASPTSTYVLIDDVLTTGATLQEAADTLSSSGATHIIPIALAH